MIILDFNFLEKTNSLVLVGIFSAIILFQITAPWYLRQDLPKFVLWEGMWSLKIFCNLWLCIALFAGLYYFQGMFTRITPNLITICQVRVNERIVEIQQSIFIQVVSSFNNNSNTSRNFAWNVVDMILPCKFIVYCYRHWLSDGNFGWVNMLCAD